MNFFDSFIIISLIAVLNIIVFVVFKKYLYGKANAGMKFLTINIAKDLLWLVISLLIIEKNKANFQLGHDIFQQLCPEDKYKKNTHCYVCKTKFRTFKMSKKRWYFI